MVRMARLTFQLNFRLQKIGSSLYPAQNMLADGMLMPDEEHEDGTLIWRTPAGKRSTLLEDCRPVS